MFKLGKMSITFVTNDQLYKHAIDPVSGATSFKATPHTA
jgi:hypothetical protein